MYLQIGVVQSNHLDFLLFSHENIPFSEQCCQLTLIKAPA